MVHDAVAWHLDSDVSLDVKAQDVLKSGGHSAPRGRPQIGNQDYAWIHIRLPRRMDRNVSGAALFRAVV